MFLYCSDFNVNFGLSLRVLKSCSRAPLSSFSLNFLRHRFASSDFNIRRSGQGVYQEVKNSSQSLKKAREWKTIMFDIKTKKVWGESIIDSKQFIIMINRD